MFKTIEDMSQAIAKAASDKKARDIVILSMKELTAATDYFIVCSANTGLQVRAIADNIEDEMRAQGMEFLHKEGYRSGEWVLLDYGSIVVHVFYQETRKFYGLESLWGDAPRKTYHSS